MEKETYRTYSVYILCVYLPKEPRIMFRCLGLAHTASPYVPLPLDRLEVQLVTPENADTLVIQISGRIVLFSAGSTGSHLPARPILWTTETPIKFLTVETRLSTHP